MLNPLLSVRLREGTRVAHRAAESSPFMRKLFKAQLSLQDYRYFLVQLAHVYTALEQQQENLATHPVFRHICFPQLLRKSQLEKDLTHYYAGESWRTVPPTPAAEDYVARIQEVGRDDPEGFVAHHYTRYLGDLSGGQAMKRIVSKIFPGDSDAGVAFYVFEEIPDLDLFKQEYRKRLDLMPINEETAIRIVDEANLAFALNQRLFESMPGTVFSGPNPE